MDENTTEDHRRWCPDCSGWIREDEVRVPADGKPRHKLCGTVVRSTQPVAEVLEQGRAARESHIAATQQRRGVVGGPPLDCAPWPDAEARELAGRMALDEAAEGNYGAAAELKAFAESLPTTSPGPGQGGTVLVGDAHAMWNRPDLFTCHGCGGSYPLVEGTLVAHDLPGIGRCAGSGEASRPIGTAVHGAVGGDPVEVMLDVPGTLATRASWDAALSADLRRLLPQVADTKMRPVHIDLLASALVDAGWVPGARRAVELPKATATLELHPVLVKPGGVSTPCRCQPDTCFGEGEPPNDCEYCAAIDGELPCPIADAAEEDGRG